MLFDTLSTPTTDRTLFANVLKLADDVESLAVEHGLLKRSAPFETKELFRSLSSDRQHQILSDLENTRALLTKTPISAIGNQSRDAEIKNLKTFLEMMHFKLADESFFDVINEDDMIEVYDSRAIQIYRNWAFFKYCPYSLLELLVNDWNTLFVRPSWVIDRLVELTPSLFSPGAKMVQYELPEYLISARLQQHAPGLLFKMKYATPVLDAATGQAVAFITTGRIRRAPETQTGRNIDFI